MTTALDIITAALGHLGVLDPGEAVDATNAASCLSALQSMLDAWQLDPQAVVGWTALSYTPASGAQYVTVGVGGDIDTPMPVAIERAMYVRDGCVTPLSIVQMDSRLGQTDVAYGRSSSLGTIYLGREADGQTQLQIWFRLAVVDDFQDMQVSTTLHLPFGYRNALEWCLADEVSSDFGAPMDKAVKAAAMAGRVRRRLKRSNFRIGSLQMPAGVVWPTTDDIGVIPTIPEAPVTSTPTSNYADNYADGYA